MTLRLDPMIERVDVSLKIVNEETGDVAADFTVEDMRELLESGRVTMTDLFDERRQQQVVRDLILCACAKKMRLECNRECETAGGRCPHASNVIAFPRSRIRRILREED